MKKLSIAAAMMMMTAVPAYAELTEFQRNSATNRYLMQQVIRECPGFVLSPIADAVFDAMVLPDLTEEPVDTSIMLLGDAMIAWEEFANEAGTQTCEFVALAVSGATDELGGKLFSVMLDVAPAN